MTPTIQILGPVAMLAAIAIWFVPMWLATSGGGDLTDYRNELLFRQTVTRYAHPWHHREPPWYYLVSVIPLFWLPLIALVPWLWPRWRRAWAGRDTLTVVLLAWVLIVITFFSASLSDDIGPVHAAGPTHRCACCREVQLGRGLESVFPFLSRDFETDIFETRQ